MPPTTTDVRSLYSKFEAAFFAPRDGASLAAFRFLFGLTMAFGLVRFMAQGWIEEVFVQPSFFFKYTGFEWTVVWGQTGLYVHFIATAVAAVCLAVGYRTRWAAAAFFLGFTYIQLLDVTTYLNHYYLVVLLAGLAVVLPLGRTLSVDALRSTQADTGPNRPNTIPAGAIWILRAQLIAVYFFAGLAKLEPDWLVHAQPLGIWLSARSDTPVFGSLMGRPEFAYFMSWAGFLYDISVGFLLLLRPTRKLAYLAVLGFHAVTWTLFDIGMFPFIMVVSTTVFFKADWPRRFFKSTSGERTTAPTPKRLRPWAVAAAATYLLVQFSLPLRHYLHPGSVLWNEVGMRFAWKVLVREKGGSITYHLRSKTTGRAFQVNPLDYVSWRQYSDMSGQPDLIVQLGRHIGYTLQKKHGPLEVRAETWVSLNGRAPSQLLDPNIDIMTILPQHVAHIVLPEPETVPLAVKKTHVGQL